MKKKSNPLDTPFLSKIESNVNEKGNIVFSSFDTFKAIQEWERTGKVPEGYYVTTMREVNKEHGIEE